MLYLKKEWKNAAVLAAYARKGRLTLKRNTMFSRLAAACWIALMAQLAFSIGILYWNGMKTGEDILTRQMFTRQNVGAALLGCLPLLGLTALFAVGAGGGAPGKRAGLSCPSRMDRKEGKKPVLLYIAAYAAALSLIAAGVLNGGLRDVLIKAINICTECIGLG